MLEKHRNLVLSSGGEIINDYFIKKPGIMITQTSEPSNEFKKLSDEINLDTTRPHYEVHGEFNSRITYMSFKSKKDSSLDYNDRMVNEHKHLSIYNDHHISILIAGLSIEASQEIVAHNEASVARLTSSKTTSQSDPLFILSESFDIAKQIDFIKEVRKVRSKYLNNDKELDNMMFPCSKAISIIATMSLKNWHKTFIGRLSNNGVEQEVQNIMVRICDILHEKYPLVIKKPNDYYLMNNGEKYES